MTTIRPAEAADLKAIQELSCKLFQKEFNEYDQTMDCGWTMSQKGEEYFSSRINSSGGCVFVAEDDGRIVGYLAGGFTQTESFRLDLGLLAELETMFIEESRRSQKIGTGLMTEFIGWCKKIMLAESESPLRRAIWPA